MTERPATDAFVRRWRFWCDCARRGWRAVERVGQVLAVLVLILSIGGLALQTAVPASGPAWLKVLVIAVVAVTIMIEGAWRIFADNNVVPPPTTTNPANLPMTNVTVQEGATLNLVQNAPGVVPVNDPSAVVDIETGEQPEAD